MNDREFYNLDSFDHQVAQFNVIADNEDHLGQLTISAAHIVRVTGNAAGYWKRNFAGSFATIPQLIDYLQSLNLETARREFGASLPFTMNTELVTRRETMFAQWWPLIVDAIQKNPKGSW